MEVLVGKSLVSSVFHCEVPRRVYSFSFSFFGLNILVLIAYLTTLSVSRLYSVDDMLMIECGAVVGMRIGRINEKAFGENTSQCHIVYHKSHMA
jgi:hypothetical protein